MSGLDDFLKAYRPPAVPPGLAERAVAAALEQEQAARRRAGAPARDRRGGWRRNLLIGGTLVSFGFTAAVATTVVTEGRVDIPVLTSVVASVPVLGERIERQERRSEQRRAQAATERKPLPTPPPAQQAAATQPPEKAPAEERGFAQRYREMKAQVAERRAAGLPTPGADRIEATARRIVERRQAAGKPVPPQEQVEALIAARMARRAVERTAASITDEQLLRFASRLSPERREHFLSLSPDQQRRIAAWSVQRIRARRSAAGIDPPPSISPEQELSEGFLQPRR